MTELKQVAPSPTPRQLLEEYARGCAGSGYTLDELRSGLMDKGASERECNEILAKLAEKLKFEKERRSEIVIDLRKSTRRKGFYWLAGGLVVSIASFASAGPGGTYIMCLGAIAYGLYLIVVSFTTK